MNKKNEKDSKIEIDIAEATLQINTSYRSSDFEGIFDLLRQLINQVPNDIRVLSLARSFVGKYPRALSQIKQLYQKHGIIFDDEKVERVTQELRDSLYPANYEAIERIIQQAEREGIISHPQIQHLLEEIQTSRKNDQESNTSTVLEREIRLKLSEATFTYRTGNYNSCILLCQEALELLEKSSDNQLSTYQTLHDQLISLLEEAQFRQNHYNALISGRRLLENGNWTEAIEFFERGLEYFPDEVFENTLHKLREALSEERDLERQIHRLTGHIEEVDIVIALDIQLRELPAKVSLSGTPTDRQLRLVHVLSRIKWDMAHRFTSQARVNLELSHTEVRDAVVIQLLTEAREYLGLAIKLNIADDNAETFLQFVTDKLQQHKLQKIQQEERTKTQYHRSFWSTLRERLTDASESIRNSLNPQNKVAKEDLPLEDKQSKCSPVSFLSYYPREVFSKSRYPFIVYAAVPDALTELRRDISKFKDDFGGQIPKPKSASKDVCLQIGTPITVILESEQQDFEPLAITKKWRPNWIRFDFDFYPSDTLVGHTIIIRVSIKAYGIEIASIENCAIEVVEKERIESKTIPIPGISNPLSLAKYQSQTVTPYQNIFISYSRQDSGIARAYKLAQTALGNDAFLDVDNLRTGEDWKAALARAIDQADIFQLFWSEYSASSEYCQYEWDYALKTRCSEDSCEGFIRPVYWRKPMPAPPPELSGINFRYIPFEDQPD